MEFFNNVSSVTSSNFAAQSFNSLKEVTKLENYKVILNNELRNALVPGTDKLKIIKAWEDFEGGALFKDSKIQVLFADYAKVKINLPDNFSFTPETLKKFLNENNDWFIDIFKNNLK